MCKAQTAWVVAILVSSVSLCAFPIQNPYSEEGPADFTGAGRGAGQLVTPPLRPALLSARQGTRAPGSGTSSLFLPELQEVLGIPVDLGGKPATTRHLSQPEGKTDPFPAPRVRVGDPTSVP